MVRARGTASCALGSGWCSSTFATSTEADTGSCLLKEDKVSVNIKVFSYFHTYIEQGFVWISRLFANL